MLALQPHPSSALTLHHPQPGMMPPPHVLDLPCFQGLRVAPEPFLRCLIITNIEEYSQSLARGGVCQNHPIL